MNVRKMMSNMAAAGIMAALLLQNMTMSVQAQAPEAHGDTWLQPEVVQNGTAGVNVAYRTQEEIKNYIHASGAKITDPVTFRDTPVTGVPFAPGRLSDETLNSALKMLNQIRYIAGIPYNVVLDDSYNEMAQAASLVNYANKNVSLSATSGRDGGGAIYIREDRGRKIESGSGQQ